MRSKSKNIVSIIVILILILILVFYGNAWFKEKAQKVEMGLAESNFPYRDYTPEELDELYPQIKYANIPTRVTPEETYANFRQALKDNNLELAIAQLGKESARYDENVETVTDAYNDGKFVEVVGTYPETLIQESMHDSIASYYYLEEEDDMNLRQYIGFVKNSDGDWKLDSL